jgi:hypothetical protein
MYHAPLCRRGLLLILGAMGKLPDAVDANANSDRQYKQFTTRIAAEEMAKWISPLRDGQPQRHNPSLVIAAYCEVNPVTVCFEKVPPAALDADNQRRFRAQDASRHAASYQRWLERKAMQSTLTAEDLWLGRY